MATRGGVEPGASRVVDTPPRRTEPDGATGAGARGRCPKILSPGEVDALLGALRTNRDRAMVLAMVLGGLRRCEVIGLRLGDVRVGDRRVFIANGKGGHQRVVPISNMFFAALGDYLHDERPRTRPRTGSSSC